MAKSKWKQFHMHENILRILNDKSLKSGHHFGISYLTPYQIAIFLEKTSKSDFDGLDKEIGGKGTGEYHSVAQYIANQLSRRIKNKEIKDIEGAFISHKYHDSLIFKYEPRLIEASTKDISDLSIFRNKYISSCCQGDK